MIWKLGSLDAIFSSSSAKIMSASVRALNISSKGAFSAITVRCRIIDIIGAIPEPPAIITTGFGAIGLQVKCPPIGPRNSILSPSSTTSWKYDDTSPSEISSMASSIDVGFAESSGDELTE